MTSEPGFQRCNELDGDNEVKLMLVSPYLLKTRFKRLEDIAQYRKMKIQSRQPPTGISYDYSLIRSGHDPVAGT